MITLFLPGPYSKAQLDVSNLASCRTFAAAVLTTSICVHFGILPYTWFYFHYLEIFKIPPQIWRFFTSFLITGPQLGIIMDTYFVYQYTSQLETTHPKFSRKEDLLWYMVFCSSVIIVSLTADTCVPTTASPLAHSFYSTSYICPDSEILPLLSRFLKMREITPALRPVRHSQILV